MDVVEKVLLALIIGLAISFYTYAFTYPQNQSPAMGQNGLIFQYHFGLPFYYQTLTSEQIPVIQNSSKGLVETTIWTRSYEFNPIFFLFDWMLWTLPTEAVIFYLDKPNSKGKDYSERKEESSS